MAPPISSNITNKLREKFENVQSFRQYSFQNCSNFSNGRLCNIRALQEAFTLQDDKIKVLLHMTFENFCKLNTENFSWFSYLAFIFHGFISFDELTPFLYANGTITTSNMVLEESMKWKQYKKRLFVFFEVTVERREARENA